MQRVTRFSTWQILIFAALAPYQACVLAGSIQVGLHIHRLDSLGWPDTPFSSLRLWDAGVRWGQVEIGPRSYIWDRLDRIVDAASKHHVSVLYTLGTTPIWATSSPGEHGSYGNGSAAMPRATADWVSFVRSVATRYQRRIQAYEIWNEPNEAGFFSGSPSDMAELVRLAAEAIRSKDPAALVVCPAPVSKKGLAWLRAFAAIGGLKSCDVAAFHFYTTPRAPEASLPLIDEVRSIIDANADRRMPLWNTEFGWYVEDQDVSHSNAVDSMFAVEGFKTRLPESVVGSYLVRAYLLNAWKGIERAYYYAWDDDQIGLSTRDGTRLRKAATAFAVISRWSSGKTVDNCRVGADVIECRACSEWNCHRVMWATKGNVSIRFPNMDAGDQITTFDLVSGALRKAQLGEKGQLLVGPNPIEVLD